MSISSVSPTASSTGAAALTDVGIGSGLDVSSIVSSLMEVDSLPVTQLNNQITSYQATLSAYSQVTSGLSSFQSAVEALDTAANSIALGVTASDTSVLSGTATNSAVAGTYNVDVTQLAQAESLATNGVTSTTAAIGSGASTTINFQFGTIGSGVTGSALDSSVASGGIAAGSLTIDGTTITTGASTTDAQSLANAINNASATTGVTAAATGGNSGTLAFNSVTTGDGDSYTLSVGGVPIANVGADTTFTAADLDTALQSTGTGSVGAELAAQGITYTGSAEAGTLQFSASNGANLTITQDLTNSSGDASGGISGLDESGAVETYMGNVTLSSSSSVTVGGTAPALAGLTAGTASNTATFAQNSAIAGGSVTINSSNDSLQGIESAINNANLGVTASIINDGSNTPYRLVLTSNTTGANASMKISVNGDSTLSSLLSEDPAGTQNLTQSTAAQNTELTVNGIPITSSNNSVANAIQGVTLSVAATGSTSVSISQNTSTLQSAVSAFVNAYNTLNSTIGSETAYDASTETAGALLGDAGVQTVQEGIAQVLGATIPGVSQNLNSLQQLGITFNSDGSMSLNSSTLQSAITNNPNGVAALFGAIGNTTDSEVNYTTSTSATQAGTYAVNITQLATQGTEVGNAAPNLTITTGSNDSLGLDIDGVNATVTIPPGTYTSTSLAAEVQGLINGSSAISNAGSSVAVTVNSSGALSITSQRYGSASLVDLTGDAAASLMGSTPTMTTGVDVEGTIGGNPASGSGQVLTGLAGSPTAGLALTVDGGSTGSRGSITYSQGYADQLGSLLTSYLGTTGPITNETAGINSTISSLQTQITALNQTLAQQQANYMAEFEALDTTIASLDSTQTYLTQELASLADTTNSGS